MNVISIRVTDSDQEPISGARVALAFNDSELVMTQEQETNNDGFAYFSGVREGDTEVFIDEVNYGLHTCAFDRPVEIAIPVGRNAEDRLLDQ